MPALERILCWVTQLQNGRSSAFTELYIKLDCLSAVFVQIHELRSSSPSFCLHPPYPEIAIDETSF